MYYNKRGLPKLPTAPFRYLSSLLNYFLEASKDAFTEFFHCFFDFKEALRARVPAALLPFSICALASFEKSA